MKSKEEIKELVRKSYDINDLDKQRNTMLGELLDVMIDIRDMLRVAVVVKQSGSDYGRYPAGPYGSLRD